MTWCILLLAAFLQGPPQLPPKGSLDTAKELLAQGKLAQARAVLAGLDENQPGVLHLRGVVYFDLREYKQAAGALQRAVGNEAPDSPAWRESVQLLGRSLYLAAQPGEAIPWLEKARAVPGNNSEVLYMLGNCYAQDHQADSAREAYAELFGVPPDSAPAHLLAAQMMVRQEFEEPALKEAARALELNPSLPGAHFLIGQQAIYHAHYARGVEEMRKEIAVNPNSPMAFFRLGDAYAQQEHWEQAIPALQKSIWLNPIYSGPYIVLGKAYLKRGELPNAEGVLRRAIQMDPNNFSAHFLLGQTLMRSGRADEGQKMLQRAQQLQRDAER